MKTTIKISAAIAAAALLTGVSAQAQDYPAEPIELVVNYQAGGMTDALARKIAQVLPEHLPNNQQVVVVNKPGGAGTIGLSTVANAEPDGYTVILTTSSPIAIQPLYGKTPFNIDSFAAVAKLFEIPASLNVHVDSDIKTVEDFVAFTTANPGAFTYASTGGTGSGTNLVGEAFAKSQGVEIRHIPFEGTAQMAAALAGKQVTGTVQSPDQHNGGVARPLVFLTELKSQDPMYSDVPTTTELGIPVVADFFGGILAPAGTPDDRVETLAAAFEKAMQNPEVMELLENSSLPVAFFGPAAFTEILQTVSADNRDWLKSLSLID